MDKREFIRQHKAELDQVLKTWAPQRSRFNDDEREDVIMNDELFYNYAISEGVNVYD